MTFSNNINAVSQTVLAPKVADTVTVGNVLSLKLLSNAKQFKGRALLKAVQTTLPATGGSFSGLDQFATNQSNTKQQLSFDPRAYYQSIVISQIEADTVASDPEAAVDIVTDAMEEAANAMADGVASIFYADGTGNGSKDFLGLKAIVDDTTVTANYGGLARATYTTLKSNVQAITGGLVSLVPLQTGDNNARHGKDRVNLIVCADAKWTQYESLIQPTLLSNTNVDGFKQVTRTGIVPSKGALAGEVGFDALFFRGAPIVSDQKCPDLIIYGLNMDHLQWFGLKSTHPGFKPVKVGGNKDVEGVYSKDIVGENAGFAFSGLKDSLNQYARIGQLVLMGNLVSFNPNRHYKITFTT